MQIQGKGSPLGLSLQLYHQRGIQCCQRRTVMCILHRLETAQGCECIWFTYPTHCGGNYVTGPASQFLNCQLQPDVWKHPHVLRDSLDLIRIFEEKRFESQGRVILTSADVNALYPSIRLERCTAALS